VLPRSTRRRCLADGRGQRRRLATSGATELLQSLLATGFPYDRHTSELDNVAQFAAFLKRARGLRRCGAAALDLAYVAAGRLDGYWEYKLSSWDVAAGVLLVQEAGGRVTAIDGGLFELASRVDLIASNGSIHAAMQDVLAAIAVPTG
jgi:myo-inositol-1(or 4)-monophosphatase